MPPFDKTRTATPLPSLPIECAPHVDLELTEQQARTMLAMYRASRRAHDMELQFSHGLQGQQSSAGAPSPAAPPARRQ